MLVTRKSQLSGKTQTMNLDVTQKQLDLYQSGKGHIQNIFSNIPRDEREFIKSGITPIEWEDAFGLPEE